MVRVIALGLVGCYVNERLVGVGCGIYSCVSSVAIEIMRSSYLDEAGKL